MDRRTNPIAKEKGCSLASLLNTEAETDEVIPGLLDEHDNYLGKIWASRLSEHWVPRSISWISQGNGTTGWPHREMDLKYCPSWQG